MLNTNVRTGFLLARELAGRMQAAGIKGRMLFITSLRAETPRTIPHYSAAKAGQTMLVKELARALGPATPWRPAPYGGFTSIPRPATSPTTSRWAGSAAEDMAAMAPALRSDRFSGYVTGTMVAVDGGIGLYNWIPLPRRA